MDPTDPPQLEDGPVVAGETVRRITCDAAIVRLLETGAGEVLDVGRKTRVISPALRRALKRRDRQCRWLGCTHSRCWEGHHCRHWADGGATNLDNVVGVCRYHHRLLHEGGYFVVKDAEEFVFCRPDGSMIPPVDDSLRKSVARAERDLTIVKLTKLGLTGTRHIPACANPAHARSAHRRCLTDCLPGIACVSYRLKVNAGFRHCRKGTF